MGIVRDLFYAKKMSAGQKLPAPSSSVFLKRKFLANNMGGEETYSGPIVSFIGRANTEILSLTAAITPIQDLHGYDHPWPAGGGKNLLPTLASPTTLNGVTWTPNTDGTIKANGTATANSVIDLGRNVLTLPAGTYTTNQSVANQYDVNVFRLVNGSGVIHAQGGGTFTLTEDASIFVRFIVLSGGTVNNVIIQPMLESGSQRTSFAPYSNICPISGRTGANAYVSPTQDVADATVYPVTWQTEAGTVYGGTVDIVSGVLTVTHAILDMGSVDYTMNTTHKFAAFFPTGTDAMIDFNKASEVAPIMCSAYKVGTYTNVWTNVNDGICCYQVSGEKFGVIDHNYSDKDSFKTAVTGQKIVYPLKTQKTYNLTAQQVAALVGQNYVWADTGDVTVTVKL